MLDRLKFPSPDEERRRRRALAKEIARTATASAQGASPRVGDLYLYFLHCFNGDRRAAENGLEQYLGGDLPQKVRLSIHETVGDVAEISASRRLNAVLEGASKTDIVCKK